MKTIDANTIINREKLSPYGGWFYPRLFVFFCDGLDTGIVVLLLRHY